MYDFPASPTPGQEYTPPVGGQTYIWQPPRWLVKGIPPAGGGGGGGIDEAPVDGQQYGREDASWTVVEPPASDWADITGKPATFPPTVPIPWTDVSGKPATYPPTLPIAQADVTGLVAGQAAQDTAIGQAQHIAYTAADVLTKLLTVDGSGSALDADLLDGQNGTWYRDWANLTNKPATFAPSAHNHPQSEVTNLVTDLAAKAPLASPTFTGDPQAPTPATADNDTSIATTAYVKANLAALPPAGVTISDTAPSSPYVGMLWFESNSGNTYVWYDDGTSQQWVMAAPGGGVSNPVNDNTAYVRRYDTWRQDREAPLTAANYFFSTSNIGTGLVAGEVRVDNSYGPNITKVWMHANESGEGMGWTNHLDYVGPGWFLIPQERNYRPNSLILQITSVKTKVGSIYEWACKWIGGQYNLGNNESLTVSAQPGVVFPTAEARNRIVNPAMQISQENGDSAGMTTLYYAVDQWQLSFGFSGSAMFQRGAVVTPKGSKYRLRVTVITADTSLTTTENLQMSQTIEGIRVADFQWGTAAAKPVVLRFGWNSSIAGTFSGSIRNGAVNRSYPFTFTAAAGVDTEVVVAIPGDTTGTWPTNTTAALRLSFVIASGPTNNGVAGWQAGDFISMAGMTNGAETVGNMFDLFDVGLYLDRNNTGVPPPWQMPDEAQELQACQRYWSWRKRMLNAAAYASASGQVLSNQLFPVPMRIAPAIAGTTISYSNGSGFANNTTTSELASMVHIATAAGASWVLYDLQANARM